METQFHLIFQLPTPATLTSLPLLNLNKSLQINSLSTNNILRCNSTRFHRTDGRSRFDPQYSNDVDDDADEFEFTNAAKQRTWWSDIDDYDDPWDFDDDDDDEFWVFKFFRAFGWMLPAIAISLLLGTGPNAFIMALVAPLGQTAVSLVFDTVSGRTTSKRWKSASKQRTKKKPFTRAAANNTRRTDKGKREANKTDGEKASYSSWVNADGGLRDKGGQKVPKYGGWDQLDDEVEAQKRATSRKGNEQAKQRRRKAGKFSRIGRVRETPLMLRLLIAVFPFLGSWTRFLF